MMKNRVQFTLIPLLFSAVSIMSMDGEDGKKSPASCCQSPILPHRPSIIDAPKPHHLTREEQKELIISRSGGLKLEGTSFLDSSQTKNKLKINLLKPFKIASRSPSPTKSR